MEAQRRTEENLQGLVEAFVAHRQEFLAFQTQTEARFAELAEAVRRLSEAFAAHRQEFLEHRQEFLEHRAETDRRFAELAEALGILTQRVDRVEDRLGGVENRLDRVEHRLDRVEERLDRVENRLDRVEERLDRVENRQEDHSRDLGELKSMRLEALYRENPGLFRPLLRRAAVIPDARKVEILEEAEVAGRLTGEEADRAAPLDLLVEGFHRRENRRVYLAVEVSWLGSTEDVVRAAERAGLFARALEAEVIPVVAAKELTVPARGMARDRGVWWLQDGKAFAPEEIPQEEGEPGSETA
ncbi:Chromosome partition protein Smc [Candidatus Thermoflexus japonica]|uniref:Chromosome partition protein Smc n=1 Tax=Candidatus Thermoflexus japonica TaxID=2035417 RepID=A0A2H5Y9G1_9CHLR|nr:Chromosome partition protein Smc [Candidatus Thermoflexus japonica]